MLREAALYKDLLGYFDWLDGAIQRRAQAELSAKATLTTESDFDRLFRVIGSHLGASVLDGVSGGGDGLLDLFGFDMDWTGTNTDAAKWAQAHAGDLVKRISKTTRDRINAAVKTYVDSAQTFGELQRALTGIVKSPQRAATIAQTEITRSFAKGNALAWQQSGIVQGKRWQTNNDEIVCPICRPLNNKVIGLEDTFGDSVFDEPMTEPPAHPNCRCWVVPVSSYRRRNA